VSLSGNGGKREAAAAADGDCYVLCVDDDADFVKSLELFLPGRVQEAVPTTTPYRFLFFTDPEDALEALDSILEESGILTMVISDQQMPHMKGTTFLARIRERCPDCVRVLLTGHAGLESAIAAINERLLDKYLTKPVENEHDFTLSISHLLQRFWMQRTIESQRRILGDLYRFSDTLSALTTLPSTLDQVTRFLRGAFHCHHASVWMLEGDELVRKPDPTDGTEAARIRVDGSAVEQLADARIAQVCEPAREPWCSSAGNGAGGLPEAPFLRATLLSGTEMLGILVVGERMNGGGFDEQDEEILAYVADTASIAIYNRIQGEELARAYRESSAQALELNSAYERLKVLDRLKDDFLTFVSHELRTPLTVLSAVEFLDAHGRPDQVEIVKVLQGGYERLKKFIETALAYRTWIVGEPSRPDEVVALADLARAAIWQVQGLSEPQATVCVDLPEDPCLVRGGPSELREVIQILLDNAVRFSTGALEVTVRCELSTEEVRLIVEDRGIGFRPELGTELLKPFTIADSLHHRSGSALHLAKANAIVIAHGGSLRAESEGEGKGARFTVTLPRAVGETKAQP